MSRDEVAVHLAENVRQLRQARGLTQEAIARMAGVTRPTWANLESGGANPTIQVLLKVAAVLKVSLEELLAPPRASCRHYRARELPARTRGSVRVSKLLPDPLPGLDLERLELPPGTQLTGVPHTRGTREYLACETGGIELWVAGEKWLLEPGDVVVFRGDQKHSYANPGSHRAVAYSALVLAPG